MVLVLFWYRSRRFHDLLTHLWHAAL